MEELYNSCEKHQTFTEINLVSKATNEDQVKEEGFFFFVRERGNMTLY